MATLKELQDLQSMLIRGLTNRLKQDEEDALPTDAATLGVIARLLKDNNVTVDPADSDELDELRKQFTDRAKARRLKGSNVVDLCKQDEADGTYGN